MVLTSAADKHCCGIWSMAYPTHWPVASLRIGPVSPSSLSLAQGLAHITAQKMYIDLRCQGPETFFNKSELVASESPGRSLTGPHSSLPMVTQAVEQVSAGGMQSPKEGWPFASRTSSQAC